MENPAGAAMFRNKHRLHLLYRAAEIVVDDDIVIPAGLGYLPRGSLDAALDHLGAVKVPGGQPAAQFGEVRRENENVDRPLLRLLELGSPLAVYVEDDVDPLGAEPLQGLDRRAVTVAVDLGPLGEFTGVHHAAKLIHVDKKIIPAMDLSFSGRARSVTYRMPQVGKQVNYFLAKRRLAGPRRGRNYIQHAFPNLHLRPQLQ